MATAIHLYDDEWGAIIDRPEAGYIEIRWYDSTVALDREGFQRWLETFATHVEWHPRRGILVDATAFRMNTAHMDGSWRDEHIVPRYEAAGVTKFAFHMPAGMPAIGSTPQPEGVAKYPTGYFGTRNDALIWLAGD